MFVGDVLIPTAFVYVVLSPVLLVVHPIEGPWDCSQLRGQWRFAAAVHHLIASVYDYRIPPVEQASVPLSHALLFRPYLLFSSLVRMPHCRIHSYAEIKNSSETRYLLLVYMAPCHRLACH